MFRVRRAVTAAGLVCALAACEEHTVAIHFEPEVGDRYDVRSVIDAEVTRTLDGERSVDRSTARLVAGESIVEVDGDDVEVEVSVERDGAAPRSYEVRFDRTGRLSAIDLVEGLTTDVLGVDLARSLPAGLGSPPAGRLEPGDTWVIDRRVSVEGRQQPVTVTGHGRIDSLGVEDGHDVAVAVVELVLPVRSIVETDDGRVTLLGTQTTRSRTAYDLGDGTARRDETEITGDVDLLIEPPAGIDAPPVPGSVRYDVRAETTRVAAS